jgi:hypothetical protein
VWIRDSGDTHPGKLDTEIVHKKILGGSFDVSNQPILYQVLVERFDEIGASFQSFLADNRL